MMTFKLVWSEISFLASSLIICYCLHFVFLKLFLSQCLQMGIIGVSENICQ